MRRATERLAKRIMSVSRSVRYYNFGYIPTGSLSHDLAGKMFGHPNLIKRLQAGDIMRALDIQPDDIVLDFGCGAGYFTVEMAKLARRAYGIDINPYVMQIPIPPALRDRLVYQQVSGKQLPFDDHYFDRVLASEILPMIPEPVEFLREIKRVLKPGGWLVISNGAGHPAIREAYARRPVWFRWLARRYAHRMPASYSEYCAILQASFGTAQNKFLEESDIRDLLSHAGFRCCGVTCTPGRLAGVYFSLQQFVLYLRTGRTLSQRYFTLNFALWSLVRLFERRRFEGGLLSVAQSL